MGPGVGGRAMSCGGACGGMFGIFAEPGIGGATPTIVPFNLLGGGAPAGRGGAAAGGAPGMAPGTAPGVGAPGSHPLADSS